MTGLPGLPVGVAGLGPAGASPCLEAPGGDSTDRQHSRHESLLTVGQLGHPGIILDLIYCQLGLYLLSAGAS